MNNYSQLSAFYDKLTTDINYEGMANIYISLIEQNYQKKPELVLELGCGTGNLTKVLFEHGYDMTGVDISEEMLMLANEKKTADSIMYINQDITKLDLYGTYDAAICALDTINHILSEKQLNCMFSRLKYFLEPGGIFAFDINTEYKFETDFVGNMVFEEDNVFCTWENEFDSDTGIAGFYLTFFSENEEGLYERYEDEIFEKKYSVLQISDMLKQNNYEIIGVYGANGKDYCTSIDKRAFFVCRNII